MKTAEEFLKSKKYPSYTSDGGYGTVYVTEAMVEFAKMHVEAALKTASEKIEFDIGEYISDGHWEREIDKDSILNSYPLSNIK